jgi:hypothetical protein
MRLEAFVLLISVTSCAPKPATQPVSPARMQFATEAFHELQKHWNQAQCGLMVRSAGLSFSTARQAEVWSLDCEDAQVEWGALQSFHATSWKAAGEGVFTMEGVARFAHARCSYYTVWRESGNGEIQLLMIQFVGSGRSILAPALPGRHIDPPLNRKPVRG